MIHNDVDMVKFMVSIDILTKEMDSAAVSRLLGIPQSSSSHDKGQKRGFHDTWDSSLWRLESRLGEDRPLEEHVEHLLAAFAPVITNRTNELPRDFLAILNVGVIFDSANCGVALRPGVLKRLGEAHIGLEITAYPASP